jgi:hypothetical protein
LVKHRLRLKSTERIAKKKILIMMPIELTGWQLET